MQEYPQISIRVGDDFLKRLDEWRRRQNDLPSRPEAIRRLIKLGLHSRDRRVEKKQRKRKWF
jgi:metal-responsive CopG/Arc/MetJ family transcriptional regulator